MRNTLHRLPSQLSAILFFGGRLENGRISSVLGSEFNVSCKDYILISSTEVFSY